MQYKFSNGGDVIRTDIKVADDTLSFFSVSLWQKKMAAAAVPGDVVLLQSKLRCWIFLVIDFNYIIRL